MGTNRGSRTHRPLFKAVVAALVIVVGAAVPSALAAAASHKTPPFGNPPAACQQTSSLARLACLRGTGSPSAQKKSGPPAGARAVCRDGTYSFSQNRWVACRFHGGVGRWLG